MFKNYFITALRSFRKHKVSSLINIAGLAIGISAALVIYLIVQYEFSFEQAAKDKARIYRVVSDISFVGGEIFPNSGVELPLPAAVRSDMTGIEAATHFVTEWEVKVQVPVTGSKSAALFKKQTDIVYADPDYFYMFGYNWLAGSAQTAVQDPYQVVLTDKRARQYFGNASHQQIIGSTIIYNDSIACTVSGIVETLSDRPTDFRFEEFISLATMMQSGLKENFGGDDWGSITSASQLFVKLKAGLQPQQINQQLAAIRKKYKKSNEQQDDTKHLLQPLTDIHFNHKYDNFDGRQAHKPTLYGLLVVALFLLLLGCINFINLSTAQSAQRAKEIGIRKTLGSGKKKIIFQFLTETGVLTLIATLLSIAIMPWLLAVFKDFIPPQIRFSSINQWHVWIFLIVLVAAMTMLAGFYPAWLLTRFQPVAMLKNQMANVAQGRRVWLRKTLTVTQFVIAQFLVIATLVVSQQISYSLNKDLGYNKMAVVHFFVPRNAASDQEDNRRFALVEKLQAIPGIRSISLGSNPPAHTGAASSTVNIFNGRTTEKLTIETMYADPAYFSIYQLRLKAGRFPQQSDTLREYLINETCARAAGFAKPEDAAGSYIESRNGNIPIVGVVSDFHTKSTQEPIKPLVYSSQRRRSFGIHLLLQAGENTASWKGIIEKAEKAFRQLYPDDSFAYNFFDETIASFYKKEQNVRRLLNWAAGLCIFISCLGLLGLVIYNTNTRTREIGVRKVLGASVVQIVHLLTRELLLLVVIAFVIAAPLAWMAMHNWLEDYAYRTQIGWWVFVITGVVAFLIALFTMSFQAVKAAMANPVESLRTE
jgi:predicted permease